MASGLSMASVNKIKELAAAEQYDMAAPILDTQELEKSLNPQFIRVCGEVYENVGRIADARKFYVRAHVMAPESNRVIFSIISFYLKLGFRTLAKMYYKEYVHNDIGNDRNIKNIDYILAKAEGEELDSLFERLNPHYAENIDEYWSYELYLLAKISGKTDISKTIADDYVATYKETHKSTVISAIENGSEKPDDYFYIYAKEEVPDKDPEFEEIREMERKQLDADYKRIDPDSDDAAEPQFLTMVEDEFDLPEEETSKEAKKEKKSLFSRLRRIKGEKDLLDDEEDVISDADEDDAAEKENKSDDELPKKIVEEAKKDDDIELSTPEEKEPEIEEEPEEVYESFEDKFEKKSIDDVITYDYDDGFAPESDTIEGLSDIEEDFRSFGYDVDELKDKYQSIEEEIDFVDDEEEFEPEVEEFAEPEAEPEVEPEVEEPEPEVEPEVEEVVEPEPEPEVVPEVEPEVEEVVEPEPEPDVVPEAEPEVEEVAEPEPEPDVVPEAEPEVEEVAEPEPRLSFEEHGVSIEPAPIPEPNMDDYITPEQSEFSKMDVKDIAFIKDSVSGVEMESGVSVDTAVVSSEPVVEPEPIAEPETVVEPEVEEVAEAEPVEETIEAEPEVEEFVESEVEPEAEPEVEEVVEPEPVPEPVNLDPYKDLDYRVESSTGLDFPEFKNTLFPDLDKEEHVIVNKFNDVAKEQEEKLSQRLLEEERMQREAEELLKSLGIDI